MKWPIIIFLVSAIFLLGCTGANPETKIYKVKEFLVEKGNDTQIVFIRGYVQSVYHCQPCPEAAQCIPCPPKHIILVDNMTDQDEKAIAVVFDKPEHKTIYATLQEGQLVTLKLNYSNQFPELTLFKNGHYEFITSG